MGINEQVERLLHEKGADIVRFVDISGLPEELTRSYAKAVVFCIALSKSFVLSLHNGEEVERDDFVEKEKETDALADFLAEHLRACGYKAYSQSEDVLINDGYYNEDAHTTVLPHKTIGLLAGLGFIGKNDLLINEDFGCAFSMCTVLTDAPLDTRNHGPVASECGDCEICKQACPDNAIFGNEWSETAERDSLIDPYKCTCALQCVVHCPYSTGRA